jgi:hypothetical protein
MFSKSINNLLIQLNNSNYPHNAFNYSDEFVCLHMRTQPPMLVEMAIHDEDILQVIKEENQIEKEQIICIENIEVTAEFRREGYLKKLIEAFRSSFPERYICITNVRNKHLSNWLTNNEEWRGTAYMGPIRTDKNSKLLVCLREENFVLINGR